MCELLPLSLSACIDCIVGRWKEDKSPLQQSDASSQLPKLVCECLREHVNLHLEIIDLAIHLLRPDVFRHPLLHAVNSKLYARYPFRQAHVGVREFACSVRGFSPRLGRHVIDRHRWGLDKLPACPLSRLWMHTCLLEGLGAASQSMVFRQVPFRPLRA